ncbi:MAG TPA: hypothetical protein DIC36_02835 [Gammaproteobacteria bacterium]|nr:hypothetical protein [Gammaproteobacteria bacterium]
MSRIYILRIIFYIDNISRTLIMLYRTKRPYIIAALFSVLMMNSGLMLAGDIKIPLPPHPPLPKIVLPAPPAMIWLPGVQVYVAHDSPYPIFHREGRYYLNHEGAWYFGPGYNGPWTATDAHHVPPGLRNYRREHWGEYQREADHRFREGRDHDHAAFYGHRHERAHWKDKDHGRDKHDGRGNHDDRGNGKDRGRD